MWKYVLKRLIILLPVLFGATFIVYLLFYFAPGNADRSAVRKAATPEEAEIIRKIFFFYIQGNGVRKIKSIWNLTASRRSPEKRRGAPPPLTGC